MKKTFTKAFSLILLIALCAVSFTSCKSYPIKTGRGALSTVGTVGGIDVAYEEIYYLANNYKNVLDAQYGENASTSDEIITVTEKDGTERTVKLSEYYYERLSALISENITLNYAIISLAKDEGITLDDKDVKDEIQRQLDLYIDNDFSGKRSLYKADLKNNHITDNYVRFTIGVDVLYSRITTEYLKSGYISENEDDIKKVINEEFVRTWHIMIINDEGDKDYQRASDALDKLTSGAETMYKMIGSTYNDDFMNTTLNGYYFAKGSMDKVYESAAYSLEVGEISGIVTSIGKDYYGNRVPCYYIIQRLPIEAEYVEQNFDTLKTEYINSMAYAKVEEKQSELSFESNDYYSSLDLLSLETPRQIDVLTVIVISVIVGVCAIIVGGIVFEKKRIKRRKRTV